ncbi:MAG: tetratricopeptide repeat protein [Pseudomonadales bacterium]|nr:tetratricopeptide repeat protein [Pseudomonadales bacterium]NIX07540.1 tetratricopeptide repeat protein [Pseudomonadales bacterium]
MATKRLTLGLVALLVITGCATSSVLPPAVDTNGIEDAEPAPQQELPIPPAGTEAQQPDTAGATLALLEQSKRASSAGDPDAAVAYVERAIRLNPRSAELWLQLARLQLAKEDPEAAVQFANKAISLAGDRLDQVRDAWLLIADARAAQGDADTARAIRARWRSYRG